MRVDNLKELDNDVVLAKKGDGEAFARLIHKNKMSMYRIAKNILRNEQDTEDAIGDTILKAFINVSSLRKSENFKPWIIRILIIVDKIEFGEKDTKIYYRKKGIVLHNTSFRFMDESGKEITMPENWTEKNYVVDREKGIHLNILPKIDKNHKYKLQYFTDEKFDLLNQYRIEIPLE